MADALTKNLNKKRRNSVASPSKTLPSGDDQLIEKKKHQHILQNLELLSPPLESRP